MIRAQECIFLQPHEITGLFLPQILNKGRPQLSDRRVRLKEFALKEIMGRMGIFWYETMNIGNGRERVSVDVFGYGLDLTCANSTGRMSNAGLRRRIVECFITCFLLFGRWS